MVKLSDEEDFVETWFDSLSDTVRRKMLAITYSLRGESLAHLPRRMAWATEYGASGKVFAIGASKPIR